MLGKTLIIAGGAINIAFARKYLAGKDFDTVICADSGMDAAEQLGLKVQYAVGDFDSVSETALKKYRESETEFMEYPAQKDATDLHIALDWVVERSPSDILLLGATGKRLDHFLANVSLLMKPLARGIPAYIVDEHNCLYLLNRSHIIRREEMFGKYISFLPLTQTVNAVRLQGFRYELDGGNLLLGDSIGVSNELAEGYKTATVSFRDGILIVVESRDE